MLPHDLLSRWCRVCCCRCKTALVVGAVVPLILTGCATHGGVRNLPSHVEVTPTSRLTKSEQPVGLVLSQSFVEYVFTGAETIQHRIGLAPPLEFVENPLTVPISFEYEANIGKASADMFKAIFAALLVHPVVVEGDGAVGGADAACFIRPAITRASYTRFEPERYQMVEAARIEYTFTVLGQDGRKFGDWTVVGETAVSHPAYEATRVHMVVDQRESEMVGFRSAISEAGQQFVAMLWTQTPLQTCLSKELEHATPL